MDECGVEEGLKCSDLCWRCLGVAELEVARVVAVEGVELGWLESVASSRRMDDSLFSCEHNEEEGRMSDSI